MPGELGQPSDSCASTIKDFVADGSLISLCRGTNSIFSVLELIPSAWKLSSRFQGMNYKIARLLS